MKTRFTRFHALFGLSLFIVSCDKPSPSTKPPPQETSAPHVTKSSRPTEVEPPATRSKFRDSLEKAGKLPTPEERDQALSAVIWDSLELDPELAQEAFRKLSAGSDEKNALIEHFAMRLAEQGSEAAFQWAKALETDEERSLAFGKIALVLSATDPEAAAKLLSDSGVASRDFDVAVVQVIQRWAAESPANAAAWVVQFDAGEARAAGIKAVAAAWSGLDAKATYAWIAGIQDPAIRDEALTGMAESILELPESEQIKMLKLASPDIRTRLEKLKAGADDEE
ncbi:MAG: hypothetical protein V4689_02855 [Verrucomicrobiota bacterium]